MTACGAPCALAEVASAIEAAETAINTGADGRGVSFLGLSAALAAAGRRAHGGTQRVVRRLPVPDEV